MQAPQTPSRNRRACGQPQPPAEEVRHKNQAGRSSARRPVPFTANGDSTFLPHRATLAPPFLATRPDHKRDAIAPPMMSSDSPPDAPRSDGGTDVMAQGYDRLCR